MIASFFSDHLDNKPAALDLRFEWKRPHSYSNQQDGTPTPSRQTWLEKVELCQQNKSRRLPRESEKTGLLHRKCSIDGRVDEILGPGDARCSPQVQGLPSVL